MNLFIKTYFKIILITLLIFLSACGKERMLKVSAVNPVTGEGYAGLPFAVISQTSGTFESNYKKEYEGTLDNNGQASFTFKLKKRPFYILRIQVPDNNCYIKTHEYTFDVTTTNFNFPFEFASCSYSKLIINNTNCGGDDDVFTLYRENQIGSIDNSFGWKHEGCVYWETNGFSEIPMGNVYFRWEVIRNQNIEIFYDTVFFPPGEQITYEINY